MPFTLTMPKLSPTMEAGTLVKWHKKEGDEVKEGDVLFEVATDKATVEYEAIDPGFLRKILVPEGSDAKLNEPLAIFTETKDESIEGYKPEGEAPAQKKEEEKKEEKAEKKEEEPAKKEKKKEPVAAGAEKPGVSQPAFEPAPPLKKYDYKWPESMDMGRVKASPLAKKMAEEKQLDLSGIKGSGPGGRIVSRDLDKAPSKGPVSFGMHKPPSIPPGTYEEEALSQMRKVIGSKLQASKMFVPHFYVQQKIDASQLITLREHLKTFNIKVTFNDLVLRATALALKEFPQVNSGYNTVNQTIIRFKTIDVCVAVTIEGGLITPIIRYADAKNLVQISAEVRELSTLAKQGKLKPEQFIGGSFTVSNLGMFGINDFQAVINPPQAAILAVGGIIDEPVVKEGQIVAGKTMTLSLSSDHRVIDGSLAAEFIRCVQKYLENPSILLV